MPGPRSLRTASSSASDPACHSISGDSSDSSDSEDDVPLCNLTKQPQAKDDPAPSLKREREDEDAKPEKKPKVSTEVGHVTLNNGRQVESNDGAKAPMATDQSKPEQKPKQVPPECVYHSALSLEAAGAAIFS